MNKSLLALLISGLFTTNILAAGQDNSWYGGARLGWSDLYDIDQNQNAEQSNDTTHAMGTGFFGGYQFTQNLAIEMGYDWLGQYQYASESDEHSVQMAQLALKLGLSVTESLDFYTRMGGGYAWADNATGNSSDMVLITALGAEYAFNSDWAARLEYQYTSPLGDHDDNDLNLGNSLLSLGITYRFGQIASGVVEPIPAPALEPEVGSTPPINSDIQFTYNQAALQSEAHLSLGRLYNQLMTLTPNNATVTVIGYSDRLGSETYNQALSERRAQTVADYLIGKGLPINQVKVEGRGEKDPITGDSCTHLHKNELIVCLAPDRRVVVSSTPQP